MTINRHKQLRLTQVCLLAFVVSAPVVALEESSHRLVSRQAVLSSSSVDLEAYFRETLGLSDGSETFLAPLDGPPRRAREWIELGGELEDRGSPFTGSGRFYKHFHDPLQPWNTAGLTFLGPNESSVRWMQNRDQKSTGAAGGNWSWHDARRMYYQALTEPDPALRQALLAATFRALGQIMHLVVDASVPEHVRDDEHPLGTTPFFWSYDTWIQSRHGSQDESDLFVDRYLSNPIGPDPELFQISIPGSEAANVPIARLIDSDAYSGENPEITFNAAAPSAPVAIGLAEIANANFFSEDKFGQGAEPYPPNPRFLEPGLIPVDAPRGTLTPDGRKIVRRYWARPAGQRLLPVNRLRADCVSRFLGTFSEHATRRPCVDGVVWDAVAAQMLPRAVGYARGVLDYFFRGSMRVHALSTDEGGAFIRIENLTDEEMEGVFEIYARLMAGAPDESREQVGLVADGAVTTVSAKATVTLPVTLLPGEHPTASQILVFRGRLGLELDGVAAQIFDVHHLLVTQTAATSTMSESCGTLSRFNESASFCNWRATSHDVHGDLLTDTTVPVLARVSASWEFTGGSKSAQIELDDVPTPGGVWQRQGTEPDPLLFRIRAGSNQGNRLVLSVQVVSGDTVKILPRPTISLDSVLREGE